MTTVDRRHADDGLAPVTDLFGASRRPAYGGSSDEGSSSGDPAAVVTPVVRSGDADWRPPVTGMAPRTSGDGGAGDPGRDRSTGYSSDQADEHRASVFSFADGTELDPNDAPRPLDEQRADAERLSMRVLGRRGVSTSEMRDALTKHDLDAEVIDAEITRLERVGLLDDLALAEELVDRLHTRKRLGRQAIVQELRRRGIGHQQIDQALDADGSDAADELQRALELATKRASQLRSLDRQTAERRLSGFLMRKGYGSSSVRVAVLRALDGTGSRGGVRFE